MSGFTIGDRPVGGDAPAYIIAEAGVNHQCDLDIARRMIDEAHAGGADAIKFQTYRADTLTTRWAPRYWQHPEESGTQYAIYQHSDDFERADYEELFAYARQVGIEWLTTPFDLEAVGWLAEMGVAAYKIASADLTNWPLLRAAASKGVPMIISMGGATLDEDVDIAGHDVERITRQRGAQGLRHGADAPGEFRRGRSVEDQVARPRSGGLYAHVACRSGRCGDGEAREGEALAHRGRYGDGARRVRMHAERVDRERDGRAIAGGELAALGQG